jgi:hypothetical protein
VDFPDAGIPTVIIASMSSPILNLKT